LRFGRNISIVRATSLLGGCAVVAGCSMMVVWLQIDIDATRDEGSTLN
jgi:hypothetical protein